MTLSQNVDDAIGVHEHIYNAMNQLAENLHGFRILDCGAGFQDKKVWTSKTGSHGVWFLPDIFRSADYEYVTMDIRPECRCDITGDIQELDKYVEPDTFDAILCFETLEHTVDPRLCIQQMRKALVEEGFIFISVPFTMGHHTPRDFWRWTEDGLKHMMLTEGFEVLKLLPMGGEIGREWSWLVVGKKTKNQNLLNSHLAGLEKI